jgi:hypothetical protein
MQKRGITELLDTAEPTINPMAYTDVKSPAACRFQIFCMTQINYNIWHNGLYSAENNENLPSDSKCT